MCDLLDPPHHFLRTTEKFTHALSYHICIWFEYFLNCFFAQEMTDGTNKTQFTAKFDSQSLYFVAHEMTD